jgi:PAS domain S-box-containing protein
MAETPSYEELTAEVNALREKLARRSRLEEKVRELQSAYDALQVKMEEHLRSEESLMQRERKYRMLFHAARDSALVLDAEGRIIDASQGAEKLYGRAAEELLGRKMTDLIEPSYHDLFLQRFSAFRQLQEADEEIQVLRSDGSVVDVWCKCTPTTDAQGSFDGVLVFDREITGIKLLREQLIRSERLAATGQLAASIAHEINSPLQGVIGLIDVMKKTHGADAKLQKNLDLLEGAFDSIRKTVKNLLDLNRPGKHVVQKVDINRVITDTVALMRSDLKKKRVDHRMELDQQLPGITGTPQQISQIIMNLVNNAVEAISGSIAINGNNVVAVPEGAIVFRTYRRDNHVVIEVSDNGPGIAEEDLQHIFDPFYTSKKKLGMGVGLSICHGIVEEYHGSIKACNAPEGGAVLTIELPVSTIAR